MTDGKITGHAFISACPDDQVAVDQLVSDLKAAGIRIWRDSESLWPGDDQRARVRAAISDGAVVFVACFSTASVARTKSDQNEEIAMAIEEMLRRLPEDPWIVPVRLDECEIPDLQIGGGRTLRSIRAADIFGGRAAAETERLAVAIGRLLQRGPQADPDPASLAPDAEIPPGPGKTTLPPAGTRGVVVLGNNSGVISTGDNATIKQWR